MSKLKPKYLGWKGYRAGNFVRVYPPSDRRREEAAIVVRVTSDGDTEFRVSRTGEKFWMDRSGIYITYPGLGRHDGRR